MHGARPNRVPLSDIDAPPPLDTNAHGNAVLDLEADALMGLSSPSFLGEEDLTRGYSTSAVATLQQAVCDHRLSRPGGACDVCEESPRVPRDPPLLSDAPVVIPAQLSSR